MKLSIRQKNKAAKLYMLANTALGVDQCHLNEELNEISGLAQKLAERELNKMGYHIGQVATLQKCIYAVSESKLFK